MTTSPFQFSEAARLYAKHPNIPDIVEEMRQESYRGIADFRKELLAALALEVLPARLCHRTTYTTGQFFGADIQYLWIGEGLEADWKSKGGKVSFFCPVPDKVRDEKLWRKYLALISESLLEVTVSYDGADGEAQRRIMGMARRMELRVVETKKGPFSCQLQLDPADPVGSAARQLASLLRGVSDAQQGGDGHKSADAANGSIGS